MKFKLTRKDQNIIASVMVFKEKWWLWVISFKNLMRYGIPSLLGAVLLISYMSFHRFSHEQDYFKAHQAYEKWESGDESQLADLEAMFRKYPELHSKYDTAIASHLFSIEKHLDAKGYAIKTLQRVTKATPYHIQFAKTSVAIAEKKYKQALSESLELKEALTPTDAVKVLCGFNLLRIASLQRELGDFNAEKKTLQELKAYLDQNKDELELLVQHFKSGEIGLDDYINDRQSAY